MKQKPGKSTNITATTLVMGEAHAIEALIF